jgi:site-specific DNA-methyltransferase (adenine-specific)
MIELIQGECLEEMDYLDTESIDLVLTDPPYGTTQCKWDSIIPLDSMWEQLKRITKPDSAIILCSSQPFTSILVTSNLKHYRHEWIYQKKGASNFAQAKYAPMKEHENILVFSKSKAKYYPIKEKRKGTGADRVKYKFSEATRHNSGEFINYTKGKFSEIADNLRFPSSIRLYNNRAKGDRGLHPTQKPVALMSYLIRTYTNPGDTVLDFTMGSGTTGVACKLLNRNFIGIELNEKYFETAKKRINETKTLEEELEEI